MLSWVPEPYLALISRKLFGSNVDGREIGARFYAMSTDPQPIRTGLRGIIVDPNKKGSRREVSALRLTHNEKKTVQHCAECKVIVCNAMERRPFCDSGSVRGESVEPPSQTGWAGWADHYSGLGFYGLRSGVQTAVQTVETRVQTVVQTVEKTYAKSTDRENRQEWVLLNTTSRRPLRSLDLG